MSRKKWTDEKLFLRLLNNKTVKTYWDNVTELRSRPTKYVFTKSYELANSDSIQEKIIGIQLLAQLGLTPRPFLKETLKLFFELLKSENDPKVLSAILYAIGHNNDNLTTSQITHLSAFVEHEHVAVRQSLAFALGGIESNKAIDTIIVLTKDKVSSIRDWATFSIGDLIVSDNERIRDALWLRVNDKDQETKLEAIKGLAKRKDIRVKEAIIHELLAGEFGTLLFEAIEELNDKDFLPLLEQNLKKYKNDKAINPEWISDLQDIIVKLKQ